MAWTRIACASVPAVLLALPAAAAAQERPRPAVEVSGAWVGFADDGVVGEMMLGGAGRWYLSPRLSVGPELLSIQGGHHSHFVVTGNLTWDIVADTGGRRGATPFLVAGGGLFQTRQAFFGQTAVSGEGAFTAGGGVRVSSGGRVFVGVDARIGWELHVRVGGTVGIRLGG